MTGLRDHNKVMHPSYVVAGCFLGCNSLQQVSCRSVAHVRGKTFSVILKHSDELPHLVKAALNASAQLSESAPVHRLDGVPPLGTGRNVALLSPTPAAASGACDRDNDVI